MIEHGQKRWSGWKCEGVLADLSVHIGALLRAKEDRVELTDALRIHDDV